VAPIDVVDVLERIGGEVGLPRTIRVDQGSEFVSRDLDLWAYHRGVTLDFSRPGKPTDNAFIESFNGKFRAERLNAHWFMSLDDVQRRVAAQGASLSTYRWSENPGAGQGYWQVGYPCPIVGWLLIELDALRR